MTQSFKSAVMVIGGGEDKVQDRKILKAFIEHAGGSQARVAIIPCASREPDVIGKIYSDIFTDLRAEYVQIWDIRERPRHSQEEAEKLVQDFTGVFMTGGDQLRLTSLIADTHLVNTIRQFIAREALVLGGTSAGAAVMGTEMISGGGSGESPQKQLVTMGTGLSFLPDILVDQHFHNRNRMARLLTAIAAHPEKLGVGIDEDTVAIFESDQILKVMGRGTVTIVDPGEVSYSNQVWVSHDAPLTIHNLRVHILSAGSKYHLQKRIPISPSV